MNRDDVVKWIALTYWEYYLLKLPSMGVEITSSIGTESGTVLNLYKMISIVLVNRNSLWS